MIRQATIEDFDIILDMAKKFWQSTIYEEEFDRDHTKKVVGLAFDHGLIAVIEQKEGVVGFVGGVKSPLLANPNVMMGTELAWWVEPEYRKGGEGIKLMKFIEKLAKEQGVKYWVMVAMESSDPETAAKIYERLGYEKTESSYVRVL